MKRIKNVILWHLPNLKDNQIVSDLDNYKINVDMLLLLILPIKSLSQSDYDVLVVLIETYREAC